MNNRTKVANLLKTPYDTYIGRAGKGKDGYFGNPHVIGYCKICSADHSREECIAAFKADFDKRIESDSEYKRRVLELRGKTLGCFCAPNACHGDIFVDYINKLNNNE